LHHPTGRSSAKRTYRGNSSCGRGQTDDACRQFCLLLPDSRAISAIGGNCARRRRRPRWRARVRYANTRGGGGRRS
jgi:hypothetical protein